MEALYEFGCLFYGERSAVHVPPLRVAIRLGFLAGTPDRFRLVHPALAIPRPLPQDQVELVDDHREKIVRVSPRGVFVACHGTVERAMFFRVCRDQPHVPPIPGCVWYVA